MIKKNYFLLLILLQTFIGFAQVKIGSNPTLVDPSAILELESTEQGLLIPRMSISERLLISSPANGLLIFNTSNNSFEVYKTSCNCWVSISDGGNFPANNLTNTAPTASNLNYSGAFIVNNQITINYIYNDLQQDVEGLTTIKWQVSSTINGSDVTDIVGANSVNYIPVTDNAGKFIRAVVVPRASSGVLNGVPYYGSFNLVEVATIPKASNISINQSPVQGNVLTANYTFSGGSGNENTNSLTGTTFNWQIASNNLGLYIQNAPLNGQTSYSNTYTPLSNVLGNYIRVGVKAKDDIGAQGVNFIYSPWIGPILTASEQAPIASSLSYSPLPAVGNTLTGSYVYSDANDDPEGSSIFQWYRANDASGSGEVAISGATNLTYTCVNTDANLYIGFGVTPKALSGTLDGVTTKHYNVSPTLPLADFAFTSSELIYLPFFNQGRLMTSQNNINVEVNVTSVGGATFSTTTVNGYSFYKSITFTTTGIQWVTLNATGTLGTYSSSGDSFTISGVGFTTVSKNCIIKNTLTGNQLTAFTNGTANFNTNTICQNSLISANHTGSTCTGNVVIGSNTYGLVLINGQCWMNTNLNEAPTAPIADAINTGSNVWSTSQVTDQGYWGYYNNTTTSGANGWRTTPIAPGDGLLYQWSAAMNNQTYERAQGVCPVGFHIPSDCEFMYLKHGLGMTILEQQQFESMRTSGNVGQKISNISGTMSGATNSSGFSMRFTGRRQSTASFFGYATNAGDLWTSSTSTIDASFAQRRTVNSNTGVDRRRITKGDAFSIRCIKD